VFIRRGDIFYADLRPVVGSEQGGIRPVLIIQNDIGNRHSPTVICAAITSRMNKAKLPTHVEIDARKCDIVKDSVVLLEQLRTIDKTRLRDRVCHLDEESLRAVDRALKVSLELSGSLSERRM
jgi:mRNA interferase MazF